MSNNSALAGAIHIAKKKTVKGKKKKTPINANNPNSENTKQVSKGQS